MLYVVHTLAVEAYLSFVGVASGPEGLNQVRLLPQYCRRLGRVCPKFGLFGSFPANSIQLQKISMK